MVRNFLSESPLAASARDVLLDAFDQGWHDPLKLSQGASKARTLYQECLESISARLGTRPDELEFIGEPSFGHFLAIQGLRTPNSRIFYSSVDKKEVQALTRAGAHAIQLPVTSEGFVIDKKLDQASGEDLFALQGANGETGVVQNLESLSERFLSHAPHGRIILDFIAVGIHIPLPSRWDSALFDSRSWGGPQGLGVMAIKDGSPWRYPLPHVNSFRAPHSFSLPLLLASAVALDAWENQEEKFRSLSRRLRGGISSISQCDIAGDLDRSLPHINSVSFLYVEGEELLRTLEKRGFLVDSGSACTAEDLQPSHVLAAMGLLTHGNIRITLHPGTTEDDIDELLAAIHLSVAELRE